MARASFCRRVWVAVSFIFIYSFYLLTDIFKLLFGRRKKIEGQVVVITGGAQGIGQQVARLLATRNKAVCCLIDINEKIGRLAEQEINEAGGEAHYYRGDISSYEEMCRLAEEIRVNHGTVSIVVCNAAILKFGEFDTLTEGDFKRNNDVNILGHIWTVKAFLPQMMAANAGHFVSLNSICGHFGEYCGTAYCTAKFACRGFMEALQMELIEKQLDKKIILTNIFPYFVRTNFIQNLEEPYCTFFDVLEPERCAKEIVDSILLERMNHYIPGAVGVLCRYLKCLGTRGTLPSGRKAFDFRYRPKIIPEKIV